MEMCTPNPPSGKVSPPGVIFSRWPLALRSFKNFLSCRGLRYLQSPVSLGGPQAVVDGGRGVMAQPSQLWAGQLWQTQPTAVLYDKEHFCGVKTGRVWNPGNFFFFYCTFSRCRILRKGLTWLKMVAKKSDSCCCVGRPWTWKRLNIKQTGNLFQESRNEIHRLTEGCSWRGKVHLSYFSKENWKDLVSPWMWGWRQASWNKYWC